METKYKYEFIKVKMGSCLSNHYSDQVKHMSDSLEKLIMDSFFEGHHKGLIEGYKIADPGRKTEKWIRNNNGTYSCSFCQSWIPEEQHYYARFCLYCGASMKNEEDSK